MASCQTWTSSTHIRHPWFDTTIMKRKHRDVEPDADADDTLPSVSSTPSPTSSHFHSTPASSTGANVATINTTRSPSRAHPAKRRRCSTLEHGLAHMSLGGGGYISGSAVAPPAPFALDSNLTNTTTYSPSNPIANAYPRVQELSLPAPLPIVAGSGAVITGGLASGPSSGCTSPMAVDLEMFPSPLPLPLSEQQQHGYIVEEADTEELEGRAPEVKMGVVSWYEPEPDRIVITDLDSFTQDAEEEEAEAARVKLSINEALLSRIRRQRVTEETPLAASAATSTNQALVLFKPLPLSDTELDKVNNAQAQQRQRAAAEAERTRKEVELEQQRLIEARDEDAMDIEP